MENSNLNAIFKNKNKNYNKNKNKNTNKNTKFNINFNNNENNNVIQANTLPSPSRNYTPWTILLILFSYVFML